MLWKFNIQKFHLWQSMGNGSLCSFISSRESPLHDWHAMSSLSFATSPIEIKGIEFQTGGRDMKCVVTEHSVASAFAAGIVRAYRALFWLVQCASASLPVGRTGDSFDPECVLPLVNTEGLAGGYASTPDVLGLDEEHGIFPLGSPIADAHGNLSSGFAV